MPGSAISSTSTRPPDSPGAYRAVAARWRARQDRAVLPVNRRQLIVGGAAAALAAGCSGSGSRPAPGGTTSLRTAPPQTLTLSTDVHGTATYAYLPFDVPPGVARVQVDVRSTPAGAKLGAGLFD